MRDSCGFQCTQTAFWWRFEAHVQAARDAGGLSFARPATEAQARRRAGDGELGGNPQAAVGGDRREP